MDLEWCWGDQGRNLVRESDVLVVSSACCVKCLLCQVPGDITGQLARATTSATGLKELCFNKFDILGDGVRCICMC